MPPVEPCVDNSGYSAKNPAVIARLHGMFFSPSDPRLFEREWASMEIADTQELVSRTGVDTVGSSYKVIRSR